ncbi:acyl-CoA thioesterase [Ancylobacter defluvii]|uniref:Thioesterase n=1 Tax=Ancylobacter defluvii TaxID=1282440 RepID=A0A9W6JX67_9HYPH|nr:thioesterase family protein [Ancylobacter defluvii]MBS7588470.1 acyl-CoA thioesterase [Ancylobacter defluvii]GLK83750.1 thioesterase [Ancylobacter defluvii]
MSETTEPTIDLKLKASFDFFTTESLRISDLDQNGHVNNLAFLQLFENVRNRFIAGRTPLVRDDERTFMLVHLEADFVGELHYPGTVEAACRIVEVRRSSVVFGQALFDGGRVAATGRAVTVNVDRTQRRAAAFSEAERDMLLKLLNL